MVASAVQMMVFIFNVLLPEIYAQTLSLVWFCGSLSCQNHAKRLHFQGLGGFVKGLLKSSRYICSSLKVS